MTPSRSPELHENEALPPVTLTLDLEEKVQSVSTKTNAPSPDVDLVTAGTAVSGQTGDVVAESISTEALASADVSSGKFSGFTPNSGKTLFLKNENVKEGKIKGRRMKRNRYSVT